MMRFLVVALVVSLLSVTACASGQFIPAQEARALVKQGATLVDVRTPEEFAGGHIEGAVNIPIDDLEARKSELKKDGELVLYCRSGARSERGKQLLLAAGFTKVHNLGGMSNWK
jgi:phage shock protein E